MRHTSFAMLLAVAVLGCGRSPGPAQKHWPEGRNVGALALLGASQDSILRAMRLSFPTANQRVRPLRSIVRLSYDSVDVMGVDTKGFLEFATSNGIDSLILWESSILDSNRAMQVFSQLKDSLSERYGKPFKRSRVLGVDRYQWHSGFGRIKLTLEPTNAIEILCEYPDDISSFFLRYALESAAAGRDTAKVR